MRDETYVRPPLGAAERARGRGVWRFRLVFALVVLALIVGIVFAVRAVLGGTNEGNPGVLRPDVTSARVV